jgi:LysR family transcriptional activator of glutamate synthase operon
MDDTSNVRSVPYPYASRIIVVVLLRDLDWLLALAEHEHVTDTAAVLRTSQPTVSRALARVEAELGTRVFERAPDGVHLTPTGEVVLAAAGELTTRYAQLLSDLRTMTDPDTGVVRLAFLDSIATSLVPRVLRDFHQHAPRVRVLLSQEPAHDIVDDLGSAAVELAITSDRPPGAYGWHPLQDERLVLVVPANHRLRGRRRVELSELADEELVTTPVGFGYRRLVDGLLRDAGVSPTVSFESQDLATIEGLVAAGLGVAIVPEPFAGQSGTSGLAIATDAAHRTIGLTWRTDRPLPAPASRFRDFVTGQSH